jgi:uncharacterized protein YlxW (UPF0749 family)
MVEELRGIKTELKTLNNRIDGLSNRVEKLEEQQAGENKCAAFAAYAGLDENYCRYSKPTCHTLIKSSIWK